MTTKYTNAQIASNLNLWNEYFNTSALMTDDEFEAMTCDERLALLVEAFGDDSAVTLGQWSGDLDVAAGLMDPDLREQTHNEVSPCSPQAFLDAYCAAHVVKFGEPFRVS